MNNSNSAGNQFIPPVNPNSSSIQSFSYDKKNIMGDSTVLNNEEKRKESEQMAMGSKE